MTSIFSQPTNSLLIGSQAQFSELAEDKIGISVNLQCKSFGGGLPITTSGDIQPGPSHRSLLVPGQEEEEEKEKSESSDEEEEPG